MAFTKKNEEAVSPVIGVILMVAITVILAAVIAAFVFGMAGNIQSTKTVGMTLTSNATNYGVATITGGPDLNSLTQVNVSIDGGEEQVILPLASIAVGKFNTTTATIKGKRVILTGYFSDGTTQMLIDKKF
ncbi:MAG: type IV pilin N-terminal domain-containing protein [Methanoregula sp.]